jgi:excisionase family DNA binding protein
MTPTVPLDSKEYVTKASAAYLIDASVDTIERLTAEGVLTAYRFGKRIVRYRRKEVLAAGKPIKAVEQ